MQNIISLSSAGGGKTTRLIERIKEIESNKILVISFTKASCKDIANRVKDPKINVLTLHGFIYSLLKENYHVEESSLIFVQMFLWKYFRLKSLGIQPVCSLVESYFIFEEICEDLSFLSEEDLNLNLEFKNLVCEIKKEKQKHSAAFFADLINIAIQNFDGIRDNIAIKYDHILIDEAQDLSDIQLQLVFQMIEKIFIKIGKSFFIVGDKKQSIYSFQGSSEKFYTNFLEKIQELSYKLNVPLLIENKTQTYRFGGEILSKVNSVFSGHTSDLKQGLLTEKNLSCEEIYKFIHSFILSYNGYIEEIMIIYERNTKMILNLQEKLYEFGMQCKIYLQNTKIIEAIQSIIHFRQTGHEYYRAKILQGPFIYCPEPEFYEIAMQKSFENEVLHFLEQKKSAWETLKYLSKNVYLDKTESLIFIELLKISKNYLSLEEMLFSIGDSITIQKPGIKFSTIHSSKGLESKIVFYIKQKSTQPKIYTNLRPFFFSTKKSYSESQEKNNLEYVALSRAREALYILNCVE